MCGYGEEDRTYSLSGSGAHFMLAERWPVRRPSWTVARNCFYDCWKVRVCSDTAKFALSLLVVAEVWFQPNFQPA